MRVSIIQGDRGYDPTHRRRVRHIQVNGVAMAAVTADEEEGFADVLALDDAGHVQQDPITGGVLTKRLTGRIEITLEAPGARDWNDTRRGATRVAVGRDRNGDLLVQVYSLARPGAIKQMRGERSSLPAGAKLCQHAGILAGAAAEQLCEQFRDQIDPEACARTAIEKCREMLDAEARG